MNNIAKNSSLSESPVLRPNTPTDEKGQGSANEAAMTPLRVLVLEDLPLVQELFRQMFADSERYYICGMCETEDEAVRYFSVLLPDVVIIDIKLREGTGIGFLQRIQPITDPASSPLLIVTTNHAIPALETACKRFGAHHFLDKGHDLPRLLSLIEAWREKRPLPDKTRQSN